MKPKTKTGEFIQAVLIALFAALVLRQFVIASYKVPTGSMENTVLIGDFMFVNKFVYGARTPDWFGIPFTRTGFNIPWLQFPAISDPEQYDVVVFKYPVDPHLDYIKRCIAVGGQKVEIQNKIVYVDGELYPKPPDMKLIDRRIFNHNDKRFPVFAEGLGSRDNFGPVIIPQKDQRIDLNRKNYNLYENTIKKYERNKSLKWENDQAYLNGEPITEYQFKQDYFFMMGDNRDNSQDSRVWGFVPHDHVIGKPLIIWLSWDSRVPAYRMFNKIRWNRLGSLIR